MSELLDAPRMTLASAPLPEEGDPSPPGPPAPDAQVPDAPVPDAQVPDAQVPNAQVPDAQVPDAQASNAQVPNAQVPNAQITGAPPTGSQPPPAGLVARVATALAGGFGLLVGLSVLASIPVLQLAALGWLLECEGRLGRGGRLREALPGLVPAARLGGALFGCLLVALPWLIVRSFAQDAALLDASSPAARGLRLTSAVLGFVSFGHALLALAQGGKLRHFLLPPLAWVWLIGPGPLRLVREGGQRARAAARGLEVGHYLGLGTMGFLAAFAWLLVPCSLLALATRAPGLLLLGLPLLALVLPWLIMAQARLSAERRFGAAFELREVRRRIARAPLATLVAVVLVLGPALPLFLLKLEPLPREARWLPAMVYLLALLPGRLAAGWAYARGGREGRAHWVLRWPIRALIWPAAGAYVLALFGNQYFDWQGTAGIFAQHAFLLPVAFP